MFQVIQRREDGSIDFFLNWMDYKFGFGSVEGEHWLGNEKIHRLTSQKTYKIRFDLEDFEGETRYAEYDMFLVADEDLDYQLIVGDYEGTAGDILNHIQIRFESGVRIFLHFFAHDLRFLVLRVFLSNSFH